MQPVALASPGAAFAARLGNPAQRTARTLAPANLTKTEVFTLTYVAHGRGPTEIGQAVQATEAEVEVLLLGAQSKLGAKNRMQAVAMALSLGMIAAVP